MKLHELSPKIPKKDRIRKGQGNASGKGTYAGRGCKGQGQHAGGVRPGFEGGQTPLLGRMPKKRGFKNPNRIEAQVLNLSVLEEHFKDGEKVCVKCLQDKKLISKNETKVKILAEGALTKKLEIGSDLLLSATAKAAIEKAGGTISEEK
ncbi:MAG: 50S ribosomal protein L15 [Candidatus Gracilibacteria bacterium]|nr:50S ribosomal protein L15 [Candidatus Gracilibacteria bacterium]